MCAVEVEVIQSQTERQFIDTGYRIKILRVRTWHTGRRTADYIYLSGPAKGNKMYGVNANDLEEATEVA